MKIKYRAKTKGWMPDGEWNDFRLMSGSMLTVIEEETGPIDTGLIDKNGNEIVKYIEPSIIGFFEFEEDDE